MKDLYVESYNDAFHFYHIRENKYRSGRESKWITVWYTWWGIPGFWDDYSEKMSKKDLERECRMSKKVDWMINVRYSLLEILDHPSMIIDIIFVCVLIVSYIPYS